MSVIRTGGLWLAVALLAGCSAMPERLPLGTSQADVVQRLGEPTARYALSDGARLQYSGQPAGQWVYNVDLDAQGRVRSVTQELDESRFRSRIVVDSSTREQLRQYLGRPALVERTARFEGEVWTWRYFDYPMAAPRRLHVYLDTGGIVRRVDTTDEPREAEPPFPQ